MTDRLQVR